jgi:hypothetical protein
MCKICNYCKRQSKELVLDICYDCIDAENVIANGISSNGKSVDKKDGKRVSLYKLKEILKIYKINKL